MILKSTAVLLALAAPLAASPVAAEQQAPLPCVRTTIARITWPTGPAAYQSGRLTLRGGITLRVAGDPQPYQLKQMRAGDPVVACYGAMTRWADAPTSRSTTVLDLASNAFYGSLIGEWPQAALATSQR
jgi:hypothetical protein